MVEEGSGAPSGQPRVVKKIVKKTVVRPAAPGTQATAATRPRPAVAPKATAVSRLGRRDRPEPADGDTLVHPDAVSGADPADPPTRNGPRTTVDVGAKASAARDRAVWAAQDGAELARRGAGAVRDRAEDAFWAVRDWRVPTLPPVRASLLTGLLVGLVTTFGGWLCLLLFSAVRGTSAGGGWGLLAVALVVVAAAELGARLLAAFGVEQARAAVWLSVMVVAAVVMLVFLETVDGPWAWLVVPGLSVVTLPLVERLLAWSTTEPSDDAATDTAPTGTAPTDTAA